MVDALSHLIRCWSSWWTETEKYLKRRKRIAQEIMTTEQTYATNLALIGTWWVFFLSLLPRCCLRGAHGRFLTPMKQALNNDSLNALDDMVLAHA